MPMRICATRSTAFFPVLLKSFRNFSSNELEPPRQRDEEPFDSCVSALLPVTRGCVAATVFGITTWTINHSNASWFSAGLMDFR